MITPKRWLWTAASVLTWAIAWPLLFGDSVSAAVLLSFGDYVYVYGSVSLVQILLKLIVLGVLGAGGTAAAIRVALSSQAVSRRAVLLIPAVWTGAICGWYVAAASIGPIDADDATRVIITFGAILITGSIAVRALVQRWQVRAQARARTDAVAATA